MMYMLVQLSSQVDLPPLRDCKHFVNLTNGLETVPDLEEFNLEYRYEFSSGPGCFGIDISLSVASAVKVLVNAPGKRSQNC